MILKCSNCGSVVSLEGYRSRFIRCKHCEETSHIDEAVTVVT